MSKIEGFILRLSLVQRRDVSEEVLVGTEIPGGGGGGGGVRGEGRETIPNTALSAPECMTSAQRWAATRAIFCSMVSNLVFYAQSTITVVSGWSGVWMNVEWKCNLKKKESKMKPSFDWFWNKIETRDMLKGTLIWIRPQTIQNLRKRSFSSYEYTSKNDDRVEIRPRWFEPFRCQRIWAADAVSSKRSLAERFSHPQMFVLFSSGSAERARETKSGRPSYDVLLTDTKHVIKDVIWCRKGSERVETRRLLVY